MLQHHLHNFSFRLISLFRLAIQLNASLNIIAKTYNHVIMTIAFLTVPQCRTDKFYIVVLSGSQCFDCYCMLVFTKQQNKLTLSLLIQYCQKVSDLIPSEARRTAPRFARFITSSRAKRVDRAWSQRRANLAGPSIYIFLNIYIGHFQLVSASSVTSRSICISGSCCIHVQDLIFIYRLRKKFLDYR